MMLHEKVGHHIATHAYLNVVLELGGIWVFALAPLTDGLVVT